MKHPRDKDWSRFVDDDLPPAQRRALAVHLADCPACRKVVDAYRRMGTLARRMDGPAWSGAAARDSWRENALRPAPRAPLRRLGWAGLAGAVFLLALVGIARWDYRAGLERQTARLVREHHVSRLGELSLVLGESRP